MAGLPARLRSSAPCLFQAVQELVTPEGVVHIRYVIPLRRRNLVQAGQELDGKFRLFGWLQCLDFGGGDHGFSFATYGNDKLTVLAAQLQRWRELTACWREKTLAQFSYNPIVFRLEKSE
jgi:hypothetical protein